MRSRKLQALDFIRRYFAKWGQSPSYGEIAAELGVSKQRASDLVHDLAVDKMVEHVTGRARGIRLVDRGEEISEAEAMAKLRQLGWTIDGDAMSVGEMLASAHEGPPAGGPSAHVAGETLRPGSGQALTKSGLSRLPVLDHKPDEDRAGS
jgi:hypothetical protein